MFNIQGMSPSATSASRWKIPFLKEEYLTNPSEYVPIIALTETWLKPYITDAQVALPNYTSIRSDRIHSDRGGTMLYIHNDIPILKVDKYDDDTCQVIICTIESLSTIVASIYRPPKATSDSFKDSIKFVQKYINKQMESKHYKLMIMGDFNLPDISWSTINIEHYKNVESTRCAETLLSFLAENFMSQCIKHSTRENNTLDLLLTNNVNSIIHTTAEDTSLSDHKIVLIKSLLTNQGEKVSPKFKEHTFRNLNLRDADYEEINKHFSEIDWDELRTGCTQEEFPELLRLTVLQTCELYCKPKLITTNKSKSSRARYILKRKRLKLKKRLEAIKSANPNSPIIEELSNGIYSIEVEIKDIIIEQQRLREEKIVQAVKKNPSFFFSYAKRASKVKSKVGPLFDKTGKLQSDPKTMADILQDQYTSVFSDPDSPSKKSPNLNIDCECSLSDIQFNQEDIIKAIDEINENSACGEEDIPAIVLKKCKHILSYPIMHLWEESMRTGYIPKIYKRQIITPIHKKDSRAVPGNYRPISLTSHLIKIFERVIRNQLVKHLEDNHLICQNQHGFRKGRCCLTQLLAHINSILENQLHNDDTDVIYLDYEKAFDKVDHSILLEKLKSYKIGGNLYNWISEYLSNRSQSVVIQGTNSNEAEVISGVPQGTVLGPILFLVYINDLESCIQDCIVSSFADDTRIKRRITRTSDVETLQAGVNSAGKWSQENNMSLHQHKFELLSHSSAKPKLITELPYSKQYSEYITQNGQEIEAKPMVRDLGIHIRPDVSWTPHISIICDKARQMSAWVLSVFSDRSTTTMLTLYNAMIRSRLEYCSPLWSPSKISDIQALEGVQRNFTSKISGYSEMSYWDRLRSLKLMSLQRRRERYTIVMMFKILQNLVPNDLNITFQHSERRGIRATIPAMVRDSTAKAQSKYDESFAVLGPKLWNCIPAETTKKEGLASFKTSLGKFLEQLPDCPPTSGYTSVNNNSILAYAVCGRLSGR